MAKHDLLTEGEIAQYSPPAGEIRQLARYTESRGLQPNQIKVLDWGCGRGRTVLWLREQGYQAYGVDIDPEPINNGLPLFEKKGYRDQPLSVLSAEGRTVYADGFFDYIMTNNVLEHVSDLDKVVAEIDRLTSPEGGGYHIFPAQRQPLEGHLFMPFVHWVPKGALRKGLIRACLKAGKEPQWKEAEGASLDAKTEIYYKYSTDHIFYRPYRLIREKFEDRGFKVAFLTLKNPAVQKHKLLGPVSRMPVASALLNWMLLTFKQVEMTLQRRV